MFIFRFYVMVTGTFDIFLTGIIKSVTFRDFMWRQDEYLDPRRRIELLSRDESWLTHTVYAIFGSGHSYRVALNSVSGNWERQEPAIVR
jgi:hypothetical protein